jgi:hypothetical protein
MFRAVWGGLEHALRTTSTVIGLGVGIVAASGWLGSHVGHGADRRVTHPMVHGHAVRTIILRESTHGLWAAIYALVALAVILLIVTVQSHFEMTRRDASAEAPAPVKYEFHGPAYFLPGATGATGSPAWSSSTEPPTPLTPGEGTPSLGAPDDASPKGQPDV